MEDMELVLQRNGYPEETHFAFSYIPVRDQAGRAAGLFCACTETTAQAIAPRQLRESEERHIVHHGRLDPGVQLITKPFTYADLAARVRDVLDGLAPNLAGGAGA